MYVSALSDGVVAGFVVASFLLPVGSALTYRMQSSVDIEGLGEINVSIWQNIASSTLCLKT